MSDWDTEIVKGSIGSTVHAMPTLASPKVAYASLAFILRFFIEIIFLVL